MQLKTDFEMAIARKYPEPVAIAIVRDAKGQYNPITLGWVMSTSHQPPMLAISIGKTRWSLEAVRQARAFVVSFPTAEMVNDALYYGTRSGRDEDKLVRNGAKVKRASKIDCVLLSDAVANFECVLERELETGDHVIFVGRVVASHVNPDKTLGRLYSLGENRLGGVRAIGG